MDILGTGVFLQIHISVLLINDLSHGFPSWSLIYNMTFKLASINIETVHLFNSIFGIAMSCEFNNSMSFIASSIRIFGKFDALNVSERTEPLKNY